MASSKIVELDDSNTCKICDNALAKYSCPQCNIIYCSLTCYQSPNHIQCSENFYKENILQELGTSDQTDEAKAKILEILKRTHERNRIPSASEWDQNEEGDQSFSKFVDIEDLTDIDSDDDAYTNDLGERLATLCFDEVDADDIWEKLTPDEKQGFVSFLKTEDVSKLIDVWKPWWLYFEDQKVVDLHDAGVNDFKKNCPKIDIIKGFFTITTKPPANSVKYNLVNILAAYAFTTRYFNGEHFDFCAEAVACIAAISLTLSKNQNYEDFETAVKSVELECANRDWLVADEENMQVMHTDLQQILRGPNKSEKNFYVLCALSDLHHLMLDSLDSKKNEEKPMSAFSKAFPNDHFPKVHEETKNDVNLYLKKVEYFLSYAKDCYEK